MKNYNIYIFVIVTIFSYLQANWQFADKTSILQLNGDYAKVILDDSISDFKGTFNLLNKSNFDFLVTDSTKQIFMNFANICNGAHSTNVYGNLVHVDSEKIFLSGNHILDIKNKIFYPVLVSGLNNLILGTPDLLAPIVLQDSNTELKLSLTNKLNNTIFLNNGRLILQNDLVVKDGFFFSGDGVVDLQDYALHLPNNPTSIPWSNNLTFLNCANLDATHPIFLSANWTFTGHNQSSYFSGRGTELNFCSGGSLTVGENHQLNIFGMQIRGLGDALGCGFNLTPTSTILFNFCDIELSSSLTVNAGTWLFNSSTCNITTKKNDFINLASSDAFLVVNQAYLRCDALNQPGTIPITVSNGGNLCLFNGGCLVPGLQTIVNQSVDFYANSNAGVNEINLNMELSSQKSIVFRNNNPSVPQNMIFDGKFNTITFINSPNQNLIVVEPNVTLTLQNVTINGFDPTNFDLQGLSKIIFGANVKLCLQKAISLDGFNYEISSNLLIEGNNNNILISDPFKFGQSSSLQINFAKPIILSSNALHLSNNLSLLIFQNNDLTINTSILTFDVGSIEFRGINKINGLSTTPASIFNFNSAGNLNIADNSTLIFNSSANFCYAPDTSADLNIDAKKRHFLFASQSSRLVLSMTLFDVSSTGIAFDQGNIDILGSSIFKISSNIDLSLELSDVVNLNVGDEVIFTGPVVYH